MEKIRDYKDIGVNRISLGIQALNEDDLKILGRQHNVADSLRLRVNHELVCYRSQYQYSVDI